MKETGKHSQMQDTTAQMITTEQKWFKINAKLLDPKCLSKVFPAFRVKHLVFDENVLVYFI